MNRIQIFLLLLLASSCQFDRMDVMSDPNSIPEAIKKRISELELIESNEIILTVFHERKAERPSDEEYFILTNERFLRYYTYESEKNVQEVKFSNCLDIALDSAMNMSGDYIRYDVSAKSIYKMMYDKNKQLKLLSNFNHIYYGGSSRHHADFQNLNSLVMKTWKNHPDYDSLRSIHNRFFDDNGNYRKE